MIGQSVVVETFYFRLISDAFHQSFIGIYVKRSCIYPTNTIHEEN